MAVLVIVGLGVLGWFGAMFWLKRNTDRQIDRVEESYRTNLGRKLPPRSPSQKKRGW